MFWFHLKIFAGNSYFVQLLLTSTLSVFILQVLASLTSGAMVDGTVWLRSAMVGMWSVTTVAAGLVGFQRFQRTLVYLVVSPLGAARVFLPLVASAASFGLLAFPCAALLAVLLRVPFAPVDMVSLVVAVVLLWLACLCVSSVVAAFFVLSPHAIVYEGLVLVPLILLSGIFGVPETVAAWVKPFSYLVPVSPAVTLLLGNNRIDAGYWLHCLVVLIMSLAWLVAARFLLRRAVKKAMVAATLELI